MLSPAQRALVSGPGNRLFGVALVIAGLVGMLGLSAQIGALSGISLFASLLPVAPQMAVSTGLCFMVAAGSMLLLALAARRGEPVNSTTYRRVRAMGMSLWIAAGSILCSSLWTQAVETSTTTVEPHMSPATAVNFMLFACVIMLGGTSRLMIFQVTCLLAMLIGWLGVSRYVYDGQPLPFFFAMSLNTALAFVLLGVGLLCTRTSGGIMELLIARSDGGAMVRRLLPFIIFVPPAFGYLRINGERAGWYQPEAGLSLFATANIATFGALTWVYARRLHNANLERIRQTTLAAHLAQVVHSSEDAIISKNMDGIIVSWNSGAEKLYGYTAAEAIGMPMQHLMRPEDRHFEREVQMTIAAGGMVKHQDAIRRHKDGSLVDVQLSISPIRGQDGAIDGIANISRDISERILAEARVRANLIRLDLLRQVTRAVGEHHDLANIYQVVVACLEERMPVDFACVCLYDRNRQILVPAHCGPRSVSVMQAEAGKDRLSFVIADSGFARCLGEGTVVYEADTRLSDSPLLRHLLADGLHSLVAVPMHIESQVQGVILVARVAAHAFSSGECEFLSQLGGHVALAARHAEIHTALEGAYNDLRQTQQAVMHNERLRALGQMASGIAHDINNSLSPVIIYAERLLNREPALSDRGRNDVKTILRAGEDIAATVSRLREFYRQPGQVGKMAGSDLNQLVHQVLDLTKNQWQDAAHQRGITIHIATELDSGLPYVLAVESELREALINLTLNALDAMPSGGTLTFRTRCVATSAHINGLPGGQAIQIDISDTGVGMDERVRQRCLEPFFTTKGERGTGLGLAMVYGIIQRHGGELAIDSVVGRGTTFCLTFFNLTMTRTPSTQELATAPRRLRLLLIDDDPIIIKALSDALSDEGHDLVLASGGQAGITAFQTSLAAALPIDLVITDLGMPQVDGRRVAEAVKAASATTPVVMLTGWGQRLKDDGHLPDNVDMVLSKPPKMHELRAAMQRLC